MKKIRFGVDTDGFHGVYWKKSTKTNAGLILMLGDDAEDYMAKSGVKWAQRQGANVMMTSPARRDYGHHNYPLERIERAIQWMKNPCFPIKESLYRTCRLSIVILITGMLYKGF